MAFPIESSTRAHWPAGNSSNATLGYHWLSYGTPSGTPGATPTTFAATASSEACAGPATPNNPPASSPAAPRVRTPRLLLTRTPTLGHRMRHHGDGCGGR